MCTISYNTNLTFHTDWHCDVSVVDYCMMCVLLFVVIDARQVPYPMGHCQTVVWWHCSICTYVIFLYVINTCHWLNMNYYDVKLCVILYALCGTVHHITSHYSIVSFIISNDAESYHIISWNCHIRYLLVLCHRTFIVLFGIQEVTTSTITPSIWQHLIAWHVSYHRI